MSQLRTVVVLGATGNQGGGVVDALLKERLWNVRAVTRDKTSTKAQELLARGVEVVEGDLLKPESLKKAFENSWAVFAVTNFFDPAQMGKETEIGKSIADVCKECNVRYIVWSSLPNVEKISEGKWKVPEFTDKAKVDDYITQIGLKGIFVQPGFFFQNFHTFSPPKKGEDGKVVFSMPYPESAMLPGVDIKELGTVVANILKSPDEWVGKVIPVWGIDAPVSEYLKQFSDVTGKSTRFHQLPADAAGEELREMFGFLLEYGYFGKLDNNLKKRLNPQAKSFGQWVQATGFANDL